MNQKYINLTTDPVSMTPISDPAWRYTVIDCVGGDKYVINAVGGYVPRAWGFLDSGNHVLSVAGASATVDGLELTAPTNAGKLVIHDKSGGTSYKVGNNIVSKVETMGWTDDAKQALLDCLRHVGWVDEKKKECFNTLSDALGITDFYNIWEWDSRFTGVNKLYRNFAATAPLSGKGVDYLGAQATVNHRRGFYVTKGLQPMVDHDSGNLLVYYPVPVPEGARKATVHIYPDTQQLCTYIYKYVGIGDDGYQYSYIGGQKSYVTGVDIIEFEPDDNLFLSFNVRIDASNTKYTSQTEPDINILFE